MLQLLHVWGSRFGVLGLGALGFRAWGSLGPLPAENAFQKAKTQKPSRGDGIWNGILLSLEILHFWCSFVIH